MAGCTEQRHTWTRHHSAINTPIAPDRQCDCGSVTFKSLPSGAEYRTVYTREDGTVIFSREHFKE